MKALKKSVKKKKIMLSHKVIYRWMVLVLLSVQAVTFICFIGVC